MAFEEHFRDRICVVTGAASGIGFAVSELLLQAGAAVFMADRDAKTLASAVEQLGPLATKAHPAEVDVTVQPQVQRLIEDAVARHGRLDFLFNNAGIGCTRPVEEATLEHWRRILDVNLWGVIYGIHAAVPIMRRQGWGHIVNTSSLAGLIPLPYQALYCATKFAVTGLSESLRFELADENVRFSVVCPGDIATRIYGTPLIGERVDVKPPDWAMPADEAARVILEGVAKGEGIIVLPEKVRQDWIRYRTQDEGVDKELLAIARERKAAFQAGGRHY